MSYKDNANTTFESLYQEWQKWNTGSNPFDQRGPGYWHVANVLHACIDYHDVVQPDTTNTANLLSMVKDAYELFIKYTPLDQQGFWADDFGWFANAFARAAQSDTLLSATTNPTLAQAQSVAETVWNAYNTSYCNMGSVAPGCFSAPHKTENGNNTVTNSLYLDFSMRLYMLTQDAKYLAAAKGQYSLFLDWIAGNKGDDKVGLLTNAEGTDVNLARWGNGSRYVDGGSDFVWIGNQGLLISGLTNLSEFDNDTNISKLASNLAGGAVDHLFDASSILHEAPFERTLGSGGDPLDYATGKGVLLRFFGSSGYADLNSGYIQETATAAFNKRNDDTFNWGSSADTLTFQNKFLSMWDGSGYTPMPEPMTWGAYPSNSATYAMDSLMCILDAQVAAARTEITTG